MDCDALADGATDGDADEVADADADALVRGLGAVVEAPGVVDPGVAAVRERVVDEGVVGLVVVPDVPCVAVVRRGVLVGCGARVVGFGAAVVGAGAETVAGATLGAEPAPKRKPTEEPGLGSQPLMPIWL